jgi:hypothetical protein
MFCGHIHRSYVSSKMESWLHRDKNFRKKMSSRSWNEKVDAVRILKLSPQVKWKKHSEWRPRVQNPASGRLLDMEDHNRETQRIWECQGSFGGFWTLPLTLGKKWFSIFLNQITWVSKDRYDDAMSTPVTLEFLGFWGDWFSTEEEQEILCMIAYERCLKERTEANQILCRSPKIFSSPSLFQCWC